MDWRCLGSRVFRIQIQFAFFMDMLERHLDEFVAEHRYARSRQRGRLCVRLLVAARAEPSI